MLTPPAFSKSALLPAALLLAASASANIIPFAAVVTQPTYDGYTSNVALDGPSFVYASGGAGSGTGLVSATGVTTDTAGLTLAQAQALYHVRAAISTEYGWDQKNVVTTGGVLATPSAYAFVFDLGSSYAISNVLNWGSTTGNTNTWAKTLKFYFNTAAQGSTDFSGALTQTITFTSSVTGTYGTSGNAGWATEYAQTPATGNKTGTLAQTVGLTGITDARYIKMEVIATNGDGGRIDQTAIRFDGVSAVPEPSTYGLTGAGALATAALVRRRRKTVR